MKFLSFNILAAHITLTVFIMLAAVKPANGEWLWTRETGKWMNLKGQPKATPAEQMQYALDLKEQGKHEEAVKEFKKMFKHYPGSDLTAEALFEAAQLQESLGDLNGANKSYETIVSKYPAFAKYNEIIQNQFDIALAYYSGTKKRLWKFPILPSMETAKEIFESIAKNAPFSKIAPAAKLKTAEILHKEKEYDNAAKTYKELIDLYPQSQETETGMFALGIVLFDKFSSMRPNTKDAEETIKTFKDFISAYPSSHLAPVAKEMISAVQDKCAYELFSIAEYYRTKKNSPDAAAVYYKKTALQYPDTYWGKLSTERIK